MSQPADERLARSCLDAGMLDRQTLDALRSQLAECRDAGEPVTLAQLLLDLGKLTPQQLRELEQGRPVSERRGASSSARQRAMRQSSSRRARVQAEGARGRKGALFAATAAVLLLATAGGGYLLQRRRADRPAVGPTAKSTPPAAPARRGLGAEYEQAEQRFRRDGDLPAFSAALERIARREPARADIWFALARALLERGRAAEAFDALRQRILDNVALHKQGGFGPLAARASYLCGVIREIDRRAGVREPDDWFRKAIDEDPRGPYGRAAAARLLLADGQYGKALRALQALPARWDLSYQIGRIKAGTLGAAPELLDLEGAVAQYTRALERCPAFARAELLRRRGAARSARKDHAGAAADLDQAVAADPRNAAVLCERGSARIAAGRLDQAQADLEQARSLAPADPGCLLLLARLAVRQGKPKQAIELLRQTVARQPEHADALDRLGRLLLEQGQPREALVCLQRAASLLPFERRATLDPLIARAQLEASKLPPVDTRPKLESADEYLARGNQMMREGRTREGLADFDAAVRLEPKRPELWATRGMARSKAEDHAGAEADCRKAVALDPKGWLGQLALGTVLVAAGKRKDGIGALEQALALAPEPLKPRIRMALQAARAEGGG